MSDICVCMTYDIFKAVIVSFAAGNRYLFYSLSICSQVFHGLRLQGGLSGAWPAAV